MTDRFTGVLADSPTAASTVPPWAQLAAQWPRRGKPGITASGLGVVERDADGRLTGVMLRQAGGRWAIAVSPRHRRTGVGRRLVDAAIEHWGPIDVPSQSFNDDGREWARSILPPEHHG